MKCEKCGSPLNNNETMCMICGHTNNMEKHIVPSSGGISNRKNFLLMFLFKLLGILVVIGVILLIAFETILKETIYFDVNDTRMVLEFPYTYTTDINNYIFPMLKLQKGKMNAEITVSSGSFEKNVEYISKNTLPYDYFSDTILSTETITINDKEFYFMKSVDDDENMYIIYTEFNDEKTLKIEVSASNNDHEYIKKEADKLMKHISEHKIKRIVRY